MSTPQPHPTAHAPIATSSSVVDFGLRAWAFRVGWCQLSILLLVASPVFLLGALSGGVYLASILTMVWFALRLADEDAAWVSDEKRRPAPPTTERPRGSR
ncbi:MAG: hypothetical protein K0V04_29910 [Deltaproteobacteria bacterium]|nr:hypothetical protein [Deltaproteobacteria bacterium]